MVTSRELAFQILSRIESGQAYSGILLDAELQTSALHPRDKALVTELVYGVARWRKTLDWYLQQVCRKPLRKAHPTLASILRLGAYQLLMLDSIPPSAAINESVKLAGTYHNAAGLPAQTAKGFVNGTLRSLERQRTTLRRPETIAEPIPRLSAAYSFPEWLVARWVARWGVDIAERMCQGHNQPPPLIVRVNTLKTSREELQRQLNAVVQSVTPLPGDLPGLVLAGHPPLAELAAYHAGLFTVQNAAALLIGLILNPQPGERILDACAGSGTKTTHLAELMQNRGEIVAVDLHAGKLERLQENCQRMGVTLVRPHCGDLLNLVNQQYDRVLLDAPCSGLGVLRRHPEAKWTRQESDITELAHLQQRLLEHAAMLVRSGGVLVYSTCTTEPEENEAVIHTFLQQTPEFQIAPLQASLPEMLRSCVTAEGFLRIAPPQEYFDGFFCAKLVTHVTHHSPLPPLSKGERGMTHDASFPLSSMKRGGRG